MSNCKSYLNSKVNGCFVSLVILLLTSTSLYHCSFPKIPIQSARINQIDFYKQYYDFKSDTTFADRVFSQLMGKRNWDTFKKYYVSSKLLEATDNKMLYIEGALSYIIHLVPSELDSFFVDGIGRYFLIHENDQDDKKIIMTGDFYIKNRRYALSVLEKGAMEVEISPFLLRYIGLDDPEYNYATNVPVTFNIQLKSLSAQEKIFQIDYSANHFVTFAADTIGYMIYDQSNRDKIIDLRGIEHIRDDYKKIIERNDDQKRKSNK